MTDGPDWQTAFNWAAAGFLGVMGWLLRALHGEIRATQAEIKEARREHAALVEKLPEIYARRDDVKEGFKEIRADLQRIFDKLEGKADV